jgi:cobalamin-dependent methionine synthase I
VLPPEFRHTIVEESVSKHFLERVSINRLQGICGHCRYFCQTDFIAPKDSGIKDYIGMFVNTAGLGMETLTEKYKAAGDDYSYIMAEALADRLAEALAEKLHEMVRKDIWGYSPHEKFSTDDLLKVKYQVWCLCAISNLECVVLCFWFKNLLYIMANCFYLVDDSSFIMAEALAN